jgi:TrmH family RNA methyltransferase
MITSAANPRMKRIIQLQRQAKARVAERAFVIEGVKLFLEAPADLFKEVYITQNFYAKYAEADQEVMGKLSSFPYELVGDDVLSRIADTQSPQGIVCVLKQMNHGWPGIVDNHQNESICLTQTSPEWDKVPLYLVLEDLQDPGNLGTIFRTAEAAGVTGIIMSRGCADIYNPKTVRATMGSVFRVPFIYADDLIAAISGLLDQKINVYATCPDGAEPYVHCDYRGGTAFLLGSEGQGLSEPVKAKATRNVLIPMRGAVESLNAATAAAVLLYEAARQRII